MQWYVSLKYCRTKEFCKMHLEMELSPFWQLSITGSMTRGLNPMMVLPQALLDGLATLQRFSSAH
jgi:hypothetical protein